MGKRQTKVLARIFWWILFLSIACPDGVAQMVSPQSSKDLLHFPAFEELAGEAKFQIHERPFAWVESPSARCEGIGVLSEPAPVPPVPADLAGVLGTKGLSWTTGGEAAWTTGGNPSYFGSTCFGSELLCRPGTAAISGKIRDSESTWIETTIQGPASLDFWWGVSSQKNADLLTLYVNEAARMSISGDQSKLIQKGSVALHEGSNRVRWTYSKNASETSGEDIAWIDQVAVYQRPTFAQALGTTSSSMTWTTGGVVPWYTTTGGIDNSFAATTTSLLDSEESWIQTTFQGPGSLSFWWRTSSDLGKDVLKLVSNGTVRAELSGETGWARQSIAFPDGPQIVKWIFSKDAFSSRGLDQAWLDNVSVLPTSIRSGPEMIWSTGGDLPWYSITNGARDGSSAASTAGLLDSQESWVQTSIRGPGFLSYWWKTSSELGKDVLKLAINEAVSAELSGEADWRQQSVLLSEGMQTLRWSYSKDNNSKQGNDQVWLDSVYLATIPTLKDVLDPGGSTFVWNTGGNAPWFSATKSGRDGSDAVGSGMIADNQSSWLESPVQGPGVVTFWWKVSSQPNADLLSFGFDGSVVATISGEIDWQQKSFNISNGKHVLRWNYSKDGVLNAGLDRTFLANVRFSPVTPIEFIQHPRSATRNVGESVEFFATVSGSEPVVYQWRLNGIDIPGANSSVYRISLVTLAQAGSYTLTARTATSTVTSLGGALTVLVPESAPRILLQPQPLNINIGQSVEMTVGIDGTFPIAFQWFRNGELLSGETGSKLSIPAVARGNLGVYWVLVTNSLGSVVSSHAPLRLNGAPLIFLDQEEMAGGKFKASKPVSLELKNPVTNAPVFYTLDGAAPDFRSAIYRNPLTLSSDAVVRAVALNSDFTQQVEAPPVTVEFQRKLMSEIVGPGTVLRVPSKEFYSAGEKVTLLAVPEPGWDFVRWDGDLTGASLSAELTMDSVKTIRAIFGSTPQFIVPLGGGQIESSRTGLIEFGAMVRLSVVADQGFGFVQWGGILAGVISKTVEFQMTSRSPVISALFVPSSGKASIQIRMVSDGDLLLQFPTETTGRYAIEGSTDLLQWTSLTELIGNGGDVTWNDRTIGQRSKRFYRVRRL